MTLIISKQDTFSNAAITDDNDHLYMGCHFNDKVSEDTRESILNIARYLIQKDLIDQGEF